MRQESRGKVVTSPWRRRRRRSGMVWRKGRQKRQRYGRTNLLSHGTEQRLHRRSRRSEQHPPRRKCQRHPSFVRKLWTRKCLGARKQRRAGESKMARRGRRRLTRQRENYRRPAANPFDHHEESHCYAAVRGNFGPNGGHVDACELSGGKNRVYPDSLGSVCMPNLSMGLASSISSQKLYVLRVATSDVPQLLKLSGVYFPFPSQIRV